MVRCRRDLTENLTENSKTGINAHLKSNWSILPQFSSSGAQPGQPGWFALYIEHQACQRHWARKWAWKPPELNYLCVLPHKFVWLLRLKRDVIFPGNKFSDLFVCFLSLLHSLVGLRLVFGHLRTEDDKLLAIHISAAISFPSLSRLISFRVIRELWIK